MPTVQGKSLRLPGWLHDILERHLEQSIDLPALPEAALRALAPPQGGRSDASALERVLERDPALAAHVLRIANSAAFAPEEPIVSPQQALRCLGASAVRGLVLGLALQARVFEVRGQQARVRSIFTHCAVASIFARELARLRRGDVEAAFLGALLHDVGCPVVLQATIDSLAHRSKAPLPGALLETAMDEFHEEVAGRMVCSWKLPEWAEAVVTHHHSPDKAGPHAELARIVHLADRLADLALEGGGGPEGSGLDAPTLKSLGLAREDLEALLAQKGTALEFAEAFQ